MGMLEEEEEEKEQGIGGPGGLLGTIRVPRNLGQIGSRLPKPKYGNHSRTGSEPPPLGLPNISRPEEARASRASLNSAREQRRKHLAPVKDHKESHSANPEHDKTRKYLRQNQPQNYRGAAGYQVYA